MSEEKGQIGGPDPDAGAAATLKIVSRDAAITSSADAGEPGRLGLVRRMLGRLLHVWFYLSRGVTLGVRAMVLDADGRVFLVRHSYMPGWYLPGGGLERGQDALAALEMELREEGNLVLDGEVRLFGVYLNPVGARRDHVLLYVVRDFHQSTPRLPDREIVECGFFPLQALPAGTTPATRRRLREVLGGEAPTTTW